MAGLRSSRRVQIKQGDQRTRLPAVACRSSACSSGNFGARPAREAGGNARSIPGLRKHRRLRNCAKPCQFPGAMEAKILRPLLWFGLLEHSEKLPSSRFGEHHFYRKTELFDRLLAFDVQIGLSEGARH